MLTNQFKLLIYIVFIVQTASIKPDGGSESVDENSLTKKGPYNVVRLRENDGLRDGPHYRGATIFYPEEPSHPLASIVIVPGWSSSERSIRAWGPFLASHGMGTMTIGTNNPPRDFPEQRAAALLDAIATLRAKKPRTHHRFLKSSICRASPWAVGPWVEGRATSRRPRPSP
ncbi:MAG: hypothetical protein CM1200mP9_03640 [Gammaproteobacteria bacterium]|nr:MAG: hypothetical protein CM1200mP9_03640 [Gammaproteobacteria bacterium]